ncbi:hypothetical protein COS75_00800 [Candidatus Pacearchaeota archaeon CG06_land_8_20_14_3_00_35_12]|nr:MAG: hypothetical protein COS75_00800 [Candidatus Pacearchaeota archaeon CG06_land_8_20_14_3_00_35_12]
MADEKKSEKIIMVVEKNVLFGKDYFNGFRPQNGVDFKSRILKNFQYDKRGNVENNPGYKQPIGYCLIVNPRLKKVFAYQRASQDSKYSEKRLQGKWSWGVGGHIEKIDEAANPIHTSVLRELKEEVPREILFKAIGGPRILGYINDDSEPVGRVHFGVLYVLKTNSEKIVPNDPAIARCEFRTIKELEKICSSPEVAVEGWSKIVLEPLKEYMTAL